MEPPATTIPPEMEWLSERLTRNHFANWMRMKLIRATDGEVDILVPWREEFISNPDARFMHGGVLAAIVDTAGSFATATRLGRPPQTIDMRVDYHSTARPGDFVARSRIIRMGRTIATADTEIFSLDNKLVASGRGTYLAAITDMSQLPRSASPPHKEDDPG